MYFNHHYGHKFAKHQADTAQVYFTSRKFVRLWKKAYDTHKLQRRTYENMVFRRDHQTKLQIFELLHSACVTTMIRKAQNTTAKKFYMQQMLKKAVLSLKYYSKFSLKNKYMNDICYDRLRQNLATKVMNGLR